MHFEDLWEQCENFHKQINEDNAQSIIEELTLKLKLYQAIDTNANLLDEEHKKIKAHTFGELLLSLTKLSLKEEINVFEALSFALQNRSIEYYSSIYDDNK